MKPFITEDTPEKIYLQMHHDGHCTQYTWFPCQIKQNDIPYIRWDLSQTSPEYKWRGIQTAPKNGICILIYDRGAPYHFIGEWDA